MKTALLAAALMLATPFANAFTARITSCHDGDTCRAEPGQGTIKIRLAEIDDLEIDQPYGREAQIVICGMICGRVVNVEPRGNSYDRLFGLIRVQGLDTSEAMVKAGAAWDYPRYDRDPVIPAYQAEARRQGRGLWADPRAILPWDWRACRTLSHHGDDAFGTDQLVPIALDLAGAGREQPAPFMRQDLRAAPTHVDAFDALEITHDGVIRDWVRGRGRSFPLLNSLQLALQVSDVVLQLCRVIVLGHGTSTRSRGSWSRPSYPAGLQITLVSLTM